MKSSSFRPALAVVVAISGIAAWTLLDDRGDGALSVADLPDLPAGLAPAPMVEVSLPDRFTDAEAMGERAFNAACAVCHGTNAAGRDGIAPPLVHPIYRPGHHGDEAFQIAVRNGVRAHHWRFGNMPPIEGVTRAEVDTIIAYVRALQRANGIE